MKIAKDCKQQEIDKDKLFLQHYRFKYREIEKPKIKPEKEKKKYSAFTKDEKLCTFKGLQYLSKVEEGHPQLLSDKVDELKNLLTRNKQAMIHTRNKNYQLTFQHKKLHLLLESTKAKMGDFQDIHDIWMQRFYKMKAMKYEMNCRKVMFFKIILLQFKEIIH
jgi:hypothetical protein